MDINSSECGSKINAANKSLGTTIILKKSTRRTFIIIELLKIIVRIKNSVESSVKITKSMGIHM